MRTSGNQGTRKTILPKFIHSMEKNLTATIIIYYMDGSDQWHTIYKTKLVIPSTQTDVLQQYKLFLFRYVVLNCGISLTDTRLELNYILFNILMTMFDFKILFAIIFIIISDGNVYQVFFRYMQTLRTYLL